MERRLKHQRNKLFLRVTLILLAVWITVSAIYCAICLQSEKINVQNSELENLSLAKQRLSTGTGTGGSDFASQIFLSGTDILYSEDGAEKAFDRQMIVINVETKAVVTDTAGKIGVEYGMRATNDTSTTKYGFIDYNKIKNALTDDQFNTISENLTAERDDGRSCELICTKFYVNYFEFIPVELKLALIDSNDSWFVSDEIIETFTLKQNIIENENPIECDQMHRNIVPKDFLLDGSYNVDLIGQLSTKQRKEAVLTVPTGTLQYIFYASDYLFLNDYGTFSTNTYYPNDSDSTPYLIEYAKQVDLWENCRTQLVIGVAVIFAFFFIIAFILCLMIWQMVKSQITQEQKRADLTNALAHDIKTPLFVISGYAYTLKEDIDKSERDTYIDKIIEQTDQINGQVHNMLNLSKLDSYTMTLNKTDFDLYELARDLTADYKSLPDGRSITLARSGENTINADKELIKTALQNLIDNAVKYSLPKSEIQINISGSKLSIANQSEPLTKADLKQIWKPYVRKDKSRSQKGNGLGLSIVKSILDLHGAKYEIKQKDNYFIIEAQF